jgi:alpha-tubulin suppressor-like RCC1 family protein
MTNTKNPSSPTPFVIVPPADDQKPNNFSDLSAGITVYYPTADDPTYVGTTGNDHITVPASSLNVIFGLGGNDVITSAGGNNFIYSDGFTNNVTGNDTITISGGTSSNFNYLYVDVGNDTINITGNSTNVINSVSGNDNITINGNGNTTVEPGPGNSTVNLGGGNDLALYKVIPNAGAHNSFNAGAGNDTLSLAFATIAQLNKFTSVVGSNIINNFGNYDNGVVFDFGKYDNKLGFNLDLKVTNFEHLVLDVNPTASPYATTVSVGTLDLASTPFLMTSDAGYLGHTLSVYAISPLTSNSSFLSVTPDYLAFAPTLGNPLTGEFAAFDLTPQGSSSHATLILYNNGNYSIQNMAALDSVIQAHPGIQISFNYTDSDGFGGHATSTALIKFVFDHDVITAKATPTAESATEGTAVTISNAQIFADLFTHTETGDAVTLSVGALPAGLHWDAVNGITGTPTVDPQAGGYQVTVTATNNDPAELSHSSATNTLTINIADQVDVVSVTSPITTQTATEGIAFNLNTASHFTHIELDDNLTYSATGLAGSGLSINATTGAITGTPDDPNIASYTVTVTATNNDPGNASDPFHSVSTTFTLNVVDAIDTITAKATPTAESATEGTAVAISNAQIFADLFTHTETDDAVTLSVTGLPAGLQWDSVNGITGTPTVDPQAGGYQVTVTATNNDPNETTHSQATATLTINVADQVDVVTFSNNIGTQSATEGVAFNLPTALHFSNIELDDSLNYSATGLTGSGLSINAMTGVISGTPDDPNIGSYTVVVTATNTDPNNGGVNASSNTFTINVADAANEITTTPAPSPLSAQEGTFFVYNTSPLFVSDDPMTFAADPAHPLPNGLTVDPMTGVIFGTPTDSPAEVVGSYIVDIIATNTDPHNSGDAPVASNLFTINVSDAHNEITTTPAPSPLSAQEGTFFVYNTSPLFVSDDPMTFAADPAHPLPNGLTVDPMTGVISGTPTDSPAEVVGSYIVDIIATNTDPNNAGDAPVASNLFTINVADAVDNGIAVDHGIPSATVGQGNSLDLTHQLTIGDPLEAFSHTGIESDDALAYSFSGLPAGVTFNPATDMLTVGPSVTPGDYTINVTASNADLNNASDPTAMTSFTLTVQSQTTLHPLGDVFMIDGTSNNPSYQPALAAITFDQLLADPTNDLMHTMVRTDYTNLDRTAQNDATYLDGVLNSHSSTTWIEFGNGYIQPGIDEGGGVFLSMTFSPGNGPASSTYFLNNPSSDPHDGVVYNAGMFFQQSYQDGVPGQFTLVGEFPTVDQSAGINNIPLPLDSAVQPVDQYGVSIAEQSAFLIRTDLITQAGITFFEANLGFIEHVFTQVLPPLTLSATLPNMIDQMAYIDNASPDFVTASGGNGQFTYSISSGSLPAGLFLDAATGSIYGTPTGIVPGTVDNFTVQVTDTESTPQTATLPVQLTIDGAIATISNTTPNTPNIDFGYQLIGTQSPATGDIIRNTGNVDLNITSVTPSGSSEFVFNPIGPGALGPGNISVLFGVTFNPTSVGSVSGQVVVHDNAWDSATQTATITGIGVAQMTAGDLALGNITDGNINSAGNLTTVVTDPNLVLAGISDTFSLAGNTQLNTETLADGTVVTINPTTGAVTIDTSADNVPSPSVDSVAYYVIDNIAIVSQQTANITFTVEPAAAVPPPFFYTDLFEGGSSFAVSSSDNIYAWGGNGNGSLGNGGTTEQHTPVEVQGVNGSGFLNDMLAVVNQAPTTLGLSNAGNVYAWGANSLGQLGNNSTTDSHTPVEVFGGAQGGTYLSGIVDIAEGNAASYALTSSGNIYVWGNNSGGELGLGLNSPSNVLTPFEVLTGPQHDPSGFLSNIIDIAAGFFTAVALTDTGNVYTLGFNGDGQLGNTIVPIGGGDFLPIEVMGVNGSGFLSNIIAVAEGDGTTFAVSSDGHVYAWGDNSSGALGINSTGISIPNEPTPVEVHGVNNIGFLSNIIDISGGINDALALSSDGHVYAWGLGNGGVLGNGSTASSLTPIEVLTGAQGDSSGFLSNIIAVSIENGTSLALSSTGELYAWGRNASGALGNNSTTNSSLPVHVGGNTVASGIDMVNVVTEPGPTGLPEAGGIGLQGATLGPISELLDFTTPANDYLVLRLDNPSYATLAGNAFGPTPTAAQLDNAHIATFSYNAGTNTTDIHFNGGGDILLHGVNYANFESFIPNHLLVVHHAGG